MTTPMTTSNDVRVRAVSWDAGEITIAYDIPTDLRDVAGQPVLRLSQLTVPVRHRAYDDDIDNLRQAARELVLDVLEDYEQAEPYTEPEDDDADEDDEA